MNQVALIVLIVAIIVVVCLGALWIIYHAKKGPIKLSLGRPKPATETKHDASSSTVKDFDGRLRGLGAVSGAILALLAGKLWFMQLLDSKDYESAARSNSTRIIKTPAPRGRILDRNGVELVTNRPSLCVVATPEVAQDQNEVAHLALVLGMPKEAVQRKLSDESTGEVGYRLVATNVDRQSVAYIQEHIDLFPGVSVQERTERAYPYGTMAAHVLGYTGSITQEQLEKNKQDQESDTQPGIAYQAGDTVGQAGIEYQYESVLQGVPGEQETYVDAEGNIVGYGTATLPTAGSDVRLTLDAGIQHAAEEGLKSAIQAGKSKGYKATAGAACVLSAKTGEVLAMASYPEFEPTLFIGGISSDDWTSLSDEKSGYPLMNRAVSGTYVSASTIKPLSTLTALDNQLFSADTTVDCVGFWTGFGTDYGQWCWKHSGHGWMNLRNGIVNSCNSVFYEVGKRVWESDNKNALQDKFSEWGLGKTTGIDLPAEAEGRVPTPEWKWNYFNYASDEDRAWKGGDSTNLAIGQGDILVTPLQMVLVYSGLANNGVMYKPHVLKSVEAKEGGGTVMESKVEELYHISEDQAYMDLVHSGLQGVIYEEEDALASHFKNLPVTVAGKTGTGEVNGKDPTSWFCCYAPAEDPQYVISVVVEEGGYGESVAMRGARDILGYIYNSPDTSNAVSTTQIL